MMTSSATSRVDNYQDIEDNSPLIIQRMELGTGAERSASCIIRLEEKRQLLASEEINARCMFGSLIRLSLFLMLMLFGIHYLNGTKVPHQPIQGGTDSSSSSITTTIGICGDVIIQHPQRFDCVFVNGKYEIVNRNTGKISASGSDDREDDDYNDNVKR